MIRRQTVSNSITFLALLMAQQATAQSIELRCIWGEDMPDPGIRGLTISLDENQIMASYIGVEGADLRAEFEITYRDAYTIMAVLADEFSPSIESFALLRENGTIMYTAVVRNSPSQYQAEASHGTCTRPF